MTRPLFERTPMTRTQKAAAGIMALIELGKLLGEVIRSWRNPKRAEDVYREHPIEARPIPEDGRSGVRRGSE